MPYSAGPTSIRLTDTDVARIHRMAAAQELSESAVIRIALRLGLAELERLLPQVPALNPSTARKV